MRTEDPNIRHVSPHDALDAATALAAAGGLIDGAVVVDARPLDALFSLRGSVSDRARDPAIDALVAAIAKAHGEVIDEDGITIIARRPN